ncbi:MAG: HAMP domain-containing sensor histidine kinase [Rhodothermales bacterium]
MLSDTATQLLLGLESDNDESLAHLAQVLGHRLRGLVASIEGFTDLLTDTLISREQRELAMKILEGTSRIERVLADLQLYGELLEPIMLPVRVDEILQDLLLPLDGRERSRIELDPFGAGATMLSGDPFLLRQALLVLIQNALDATRKEGRIRVDARLDGSMVFLEVWNEGVIGIERAGHAVFVPFYTTKAANLGVGLSIARRIARLHGGGVELTANSETEGTRFALSVPLDV